MSSIMEKHSFFGSKYRHSAIKDLARYEGFFPKFHESSYGRFSVIKSEKTSPSSTRSSSFSFTDDGFSNTSSSFSSEEDSPGYLKFSSNFTSFYGCAQSIHNTPNSKRHSPRKPLKPMKSVNESDPDFKGVTFQIKPKLTSKGSKEKTHAQLVIDCSYTGRKKKRHHHSPNSRRSLSPKLNPAIYKLGQSPGYLYSDTCFDPDLGVAPLHMEKECASCGVGKTPLWRDAEDGTPLCNACGIRYKKYRIRCLHCWYIPKKEEKALPCCPCCGHTFKVSIPRRGSLTSD